MQIRTMGYKSTVWNMD